MLFYNLNKPSEKADFRKATIQGLGSEKGLFFPEHIPHYPSEWFQQIGKYPNEEIAWYVMRQYVGDSIPEDRLRTILSETIAFDMPLFSISRGVQTLELFHGPTLAFKDVGARFMSRCLGYFMKGHDQPVTVLVATSGDTGGAVASGFYDVEGVKVVILYPAGKVSPVQELQLTTHGKNISAIEVAGSFDDCQSLVKQAFSDAALNEKIFLTSANSINVARWLPQQIYYFLAWKQWADKSKPPVISVPSGNFGNICAGLLAYHSGLPVRHFIAACNANNTVPEFMQTEHYEPRQAVATISNAMDVGNPSNFVRVLELFHSQFGDLKKVFSSYSIDDETTRTAIKKLHEKYHYLPDPHGAVGYTALDNYLADKPDLKGMFLETAHPVKFYDVVEPIINEKVPVPETVATILHNKKHAVKMGVRYKEFKDYLMQ